MMKNLSILKNCTLLLVDDDIKQRETLKNTFCLFFKDVIEASNGIEAMEVFNSNSIDVVVSDYVMPIMDGYGLCKEIRIINKKIPIIIMSSYDDNEKLHNMISMHLMEYLIKPITYDQIKEILYTTIQEMMSNDGILFKITQDLQYNVLTKSLINAKEQTEIYLIPKEIILLDIFIQKPNIPITDDEIAFALEKNGDIAYKTIRNMVSGLRKKIGKKCIKNIQGVGYIFHWDED